MFGGFCQRGTGVLGIIEERACLIFVVCVRETWVDCLPLIKSRIK